jgi:hypothetical protein
VWPGTPPRREGLRQACEPSYGRCWSHCAHVEAEARQRQDLSKWAGPKQHLHCLLPGLFYLSELHGNWRSWDRKSDVQLEQAGMRLSEPPPAPSDEVSDLAPSAGSC